jgi:predicted nuclease with TOPRIM domain
VNDAQAWALIVLLAGMMVTMYLEIRGDRKELRAGLEGIRVEINGLRGELSELKVLVGRMDERLKNLEMR